MFKGYEEFYVDASLSLSEYELWRLAQFEEVGIIRSFYVPTQVTDNLYNI